MLSDYENIYLHFFMCVLFIKILKCVFVKNKKEIKKIIIMKSKIAKCEQNNKGIKKIYNTDT